MCSYKKYTIYKKYWLSGSIKNNLTKWKISLTQIYKNSNFIYFKHFLVLNYFFLWKNKPKNSFLIFFFLNLKYGEHFYIWENYNFKFLYFNLVLPITKFKSYLEKNFYSSLYKYNLNFFHKKWKVIEYYFLPKKFWFNKFFLKKFVNLTDFLNLFNYTINNVNKYFYLLNLLNTQIFSSKFDYQYLFFSKLISDNLEKCFSYPQIMDYNLLTFFKKNPKFKKYFFKFLKNIPNDYNSFWSFLNVSLFFTWSFLFQYNIPNSGLNMLYLKSFNLMYFWVGDIWKSFKLSHKFIWDWRNFIYRIGQPYRSLRLGSSKKKVFFQHTYYSYENNTSKYYYSEIKKIKNYNYLFNNYLFVNNYNLLKKKK